MFILHMLLLVLSVIQNDNQILFPFRDPQVLMLEKVVGFILNVPSEYRLGPVQLPLRRKHWIAIRSIRGIYYNLDSKLENPEIIGKVSLLNCVSIGDKGTC